MTTEGFSDPTIALKARDAFSRMMVRVLDEERPPYEYGTVVTIDPILNKCEVQLPGDPNPITVKFGAVRPLFVGQVVRISGNRGDRFISDVIGGAAASDTVVANLAAPASLDLAPDLSGVWAYWTAVVGAVKYELHIADNNLFTVNNRVFQTFNTQFVLSNLTPGSTYYARVRALTSANQPGPWSAVDSATAAVIAYQPSDGIAPASSPQPVVTAGLGFLLAEWVATSNNDPVTYEVHISTVSGFTPVAGTKIGETAGTFYFARRQGSGAGNATLVYGTTYYIRLIAKDKDGAAAAGAQGSGATVQVQTGDVGRIDTSEIGDGVAPSSSPSLATGITNGIGYLYAKWDHVSNPDAVTYEVHVSETTGFTPNSNTLVGTTPSNFFFIRKQGPGGTPANGTLVYGTTYFVKLIAKDIDGQAAAGVQGSGTAIQAAGTDIGPNSISTGHVNANTVTAASGILADLAVGTAKIQDLAVSTAKVADLAVSTAKIADLAVSTAKIDNLAVSTAKIANLAVTDAKIDTLSVAKLTSGTIAAQTVTIGASGSVLSSDYVASTSGWKIAPGLAEFNGAALSGTTITGGTIRTASSGQRIQMDPTNLNRLKFFSGSGSETAEGYISVDIAASRGIVLMRTPSVGFGTASITMNSQSTTGASSQVALSADLVTCTADFQATGFVAVNGNLTCATDTILGNGRVRIRAGVSEVAFGDGGSWPVGLYKSVGVSEIRTDNNFSCWILTGRGNNGHFGATTQARSGNNTSVDWTGGTFQHWVDATNVKNFIIQHPSVKKKDSYLIHTTLEGPENAVFYRGEGELVDGVCWVQLPEYFEDLVAKEGRTVMVQPIIQDFDIPTPERVRSAQLLGSTLGGLKKDLPFRPFGVPYLAVTPVVDGWFIVMEGGGFRGPDTKFYWEVKGIRKDVPKLLVEPKKKEIDVHGDGPYTYYSIKENA